MDCRHQQKGTHGGTILFVSKDAAPIVARGAKRWNKKRQTYADHKSYAAGQHQQLELASGIEAARYVNGEEGKDQENDCTHDALARAIRPRTRYQSEDGEP